MAVSNTYQAIATTTLGSNATTVTFSSISSAYTDLVFIIRCNWTTTGNAPVILTFNNDSTSNYSYVRLFGNGSTATSDEITSNTPNGMDIGYMPGTDGTAPGTIIFNIMNYSNTTTYKTSLDRWESNASVSGKQYVAAEAGLWRSTAAINRIDLVFPSSAFATGSTFTLYGIKAA